MSLTQTITLPSTDPRGPKAVAIATDAGQWLRCRTRDGRKAYGIRSSRDANHVYFVTRSSCTCYDGQRKAPPSAVDDPAEATCECGRTIQRQRERMDAEVKSGQFWERF